GEEISSLLAEADRVATEMRERAAADADRWRTDAEADAAATRAEAASDAEALRGDAWAAAQSMIDDTAAATSEDLADAQDRARAIRAEAEREAHRLTAGSRRESDEQIRVAKMEAERLVKEAEAEREIIIEAARRTAEQAQERARALEVRRDELLGELESVRGTVQRLESEIDEKRQQLEPEPEPEESEPVAQWGDGIRVIPPPDVDEAAPVSDDLGEPVDALAMVEEVRRIHDLEPGKGHVRVVPAEEDDAAAESEALLDEAEDQPDPEDAPVPEVEEEPTVEADVDEPVPSGGDELSELFSALRGDEPSSESESESEPDPDPEPEPEPEPQPTPKPAADEAPDHAPLLTARTTALLSVVNGALRGIKRELADAQNRALEALRVEGEWTPSQSLLSEQFAERLDEVRTASYAIGWAAGGGEGDPDGTPEDVSAFAGDLAGSLHRAVGKGADTAAKSTELSRTFRSWRTDSAERHLRAEAIRAHAEGVAAAIRSVGGTPRLVAAERGCSQCRAAAGPLDGGVPPLHADCNCVVA
ncbi:MAG: hypothetical protein HKN46_09725, partial [Acidimicrobiia bacterium]|nr:hypothetical protein [Acidimicrobiia bacterium]